MQYVTRTQIIRTQDMTYHIHPIWVVYREAVTEGVL